ncbi:MAG: lactoylglutathione lyase [Patescibacteria group bacterium]|nr:lactoylglutathione lyase [Patescibacteria group bacterium]
MQYQKQVFISLPVTDLAASTAFYEKLGFVKNEAFSNPMGSFLVWSDAITVTLITHDFFTQMAPGKTFADPHTMSQVGLGLSLESREAVDAFAATAVANGGKSVVAPGSEESDGGMYGMSVEDPDGHVWDVMWMDMTKMPPTQA